MTRSALRKVALQILRAGLDAVEPGRLVRQNLRVTGTGISAGGVKIRTSKRLFMVAVGKAAIPMARAAHRILGTRLRSGIVIAPVKAPRMSRMKIFVARHPVPDAAGVKAGEAVIRLLATAQEDDVILLLLSGGASALMPAPIEGVSLADKQRVTRRLLKVGATIAEMNAVRKRLSRLKGGGFARLAAPARVVALALSDVPGDDVSTIASGPAVEDSRVATLARKAVQKHVRIENDLPPSVRAALEKAPLKRSTEIRADTRVIGSGRTFAEGARRKATSLGFACEVIPDALHGEARDMGPALVAAFRRSKNSRPKCLIVSGETVVKVKGRGIGGRNQELALSAIPALENMAQPTVFAAFATDGRDGPTTASGGMVDDETGTKARALHLSVTKALRQNSSHDALRRTGALIVTGPTSTNVADIALVLG
ncbi:MAG: DUF4147 domain-containing protein [Vicinamibacteria bacterium]